MIGRILTSLGVWTATPWAFGIFAVYAVCWLAFGRQSLDWHGTATLATWLMTLCIQRAEHRDTQAIQAKLDELLRAQHEASSELTALDKQEPEEIERHRDGRQAQDGGSESSAR